MRITGDCPIYDPAIISQVITLYEENTDYASNTDPANVSRWFGYGVFTFDSLKEANRGAKTTHEREHVTPFLRANNRLKSVNLLNDTDLSKERWTVDDPEDLVVIKNILNGFAPNLDFRGRTFLN